MLQLSFWFWLKLELRFFPACQFDWRDIFIDSQPEGVREQFKEDAHNHKFNEFFYLGVRKDHKRLRIGGLKDEIETLWQFFHCSSNFLFPSS